MDMFIRGGIGLLPFRAMRFYLRFGRFIGEFCAGYSNQLCITILTFMSIELKMWAELYALGWTEFVNHSTRSYCLRKWD